ncbi:unnamed protein product [Hymenolepis diminuta]|uniref:Uncharacterized protein n=1 Tax=Hymenolepis diminuta TaxID=6216 RepID=A0A564YPX9_HYMDI|nr:unnamed protein product [Hymenolepis diminuta]
MTQNAYLLRLNAPTDPPFYNRLVSLKSASGLMFSRGPTQVTHIKLCFSMQGITHMYQLPAPTLPSRLLHSSALSPPSLSYSLQSSLGLP